MPKRKKWQKPRVKISKFNKEGRKTSKWVEWSPINTSATSAISATSTASIRADSTATIPGTHREEDPSPQIVPDPESYNSKKERVKEAWADLREKLVHTGRQQAKPPTNICYFCREEISTSSVLYCRDCSPLGMYCWPCFDKCHRSPSLHSAQEWKDGCFQPYVYHKILSLPHQDRCGYRQFKSVKVFDQDGRLQYVDVAVCTCEPELATLLQHGLWGATPTKPQTAFSVSLLEWQVLLSMEAQVSVEAFCRAVRWKNNLTLREMNSLHRALIGESIAEFQHYMDRMKSLQDLTPLLDDGTHCPACPKADGEKIVAIDANFGLVRKASSGVSAGPPLHGTTMFLEDEEVSSFIEKYYKEEKPADQDCSNFKAGNCLRSDATQKKLDVTGVFGSACRHDIPIKFVNMFHGERFGYPVYLIRQLLDEATPRNIQLKIIYDVACSLAAHLRNTNQDVLLQQLSLAVDVFHSYGHKPLCQVQYSTRRLAGFGLTDGEGVERMWSFLRKFSRMSKEMTPDHRIDKLSGALRHYSMRKVVDIEVYLDQKMDKAVKAGAIAKENLKEAIDEAGGLASRDDVNKWRDMEREVMSKRKQVTATRTCKWKKEYVSKLVRLKNLAQTISDCSEDTELAVHHSAYMKLETTLKTIETKHGILDNRWQPTDEAFMDAMKDLDTEERNQHLATMRSASYKRSFLVSLKRRYPDGQGIALKLSKQLKLINIKLSKAIKAYNDIDWDPQSQEFPSTVRFTEASDPCWDIYQTLDATMGEPGLPYSLKRKAIDAVNLQERAEEEQEMILAEILRVWFHFLAQHDIAEDALKRQDSKNVAEKAVLLQHIMALEKRLHRMYGLFTVHIGNIPAPPSSYIQSTIQSVMCHSDSGTAEMDDVSEDDEHNDSDKANMDYILSDDDDEEEDDDEFIEGELEQ